MKISCAIVDDNIESVEILKSHVAKVPYLNLIGGYTNAVEAMKGFREHSIDLLFNGYSYAAVEWLGTCENAT